MYFERYLEFNNLRWPRHTVSSEFCTAERDILLGIHKKAMSTGPTAMFPWFAEMQRHNFARLFLGTKHILGM